jgi:hypothetical protein
MSVDDKRVTLLLTFLAIPHVMSPVALHVHDHNKFDAQAHEVHVQVAQDVTCPLPSRLR